MIVLDTNVLSELMRTRPDARVINWVDAQAFERPVITAVTVAEILYGIARLPAVNKQRQLEMMADGLINEDFAGRILSFDLPAARQYAEIVADRKRIGRPLHTADAMIASVCRAHGANLATRNVRDFEGTGVVVTDPWAIPDASL